jgi:drug/metabolite transporter (DMT)-like permease
MATRFYGFANPWVQLGLSALCVTVSEVFLKRGATETAHLSAAWMWTGFTGLASAWVWGGMLLVVLSFASWLYVIRHIPLTVAFPLSNVVHVLVPLSCWILLGEAISTRRWCGIALVLVGLAIVAQPVAKLEERL